MNFHDNKLWQQSFVALMDIYHAFDGMSEESREEEEETVEAILISSQQVAAKIADGLSRTDKRIGYSLLGDAVGLVAMARTQLAIGWGRGLFDDEIFKKLDEQYQTLTQNLQSHK